MTTDTVLNIIALHMSIFGVAAYITLLLEDK